MQRYKTMVLRKAIQQNENDLIEKGERIWEFKKQAFLPSNR